ncbi:MAG: phosphate/phosphite/phosphonate ABC transporter substrate-binding protein [Gammaproteobacteria bacterium]|nr:phosphate/phosphite/phosphonate ABC transporter substrate-binding protein [Gammaproteobacteria bacterium]
MKNFLWCNKRTLKVWLLCLLPLWLTPASAEEPLIFALHPYLHTTTLIERFTPLIDYLSGRLNRKIVIHIAKSYADHIQNMALGEVDFGFMGPASYVQLWQSGAAHQLLGRLKYGEKSSFRGAIIVRQESPLTTLAELKGHSFAFGDPNSTLSSQVPRGMLAKAGVELTDLSRFNHLKNHHNVALAVLMGNYDAGAIKSEVYDEYAERGLRALSWSPFIATHPFVASPRLPKRVADEIAEILYDIERQPDAPTILNDIEKGVTAIIPAKAADYQNLADYIAPYVDREKTVVP